MRLHQANSPRPAVYACACAHDLCRRCHNRTISGRCLRPRAWSAAVDCAERPRRAAIGRHRHGATHRGSTSLRHRGRQHHAVAGDSSGWRDGADVRKLSRLCRQPCLCARDARPLQMRHVLNTTGRECPARSGHHARLQRLDHVLFDVLAHGHVPAPGRRWHAGPTRPPTRAPPSCGASPQLGAARPVVDVAMLDRDIELVAVAIARG